MNFYLRQLCLQCVLYLGLLAVPIFTKAGTPDGKYREKYANGKVKVTGFYKNASKHKVWMYYDEYGRMTLKEKWKMGTLLWKAEYEEGRLSRTIDKDGKVLERPKCGCN